MFGAGTFSTSAMTLCPKMAAGPIMEHPTERGPEITFIWDNSAADLYSMLTFDASGEGGVPFT